MDRPGVLRMLRPAATLALAATALSGVLAGALGCRRGAPRRAGRHGDVVVVRSLPSGTRRDAAAETMARALDERLGRACPARIRLVGPAFSDADADRTAIARACVDAALARSGIAPRTAEPWRTALVALASLSRDEVDAPRACAERAIAREIVARGGGARTLGLPASSPIADAGAPDPRATRAVAFSFLEVLAARPGVGLSGALRFVRDRARRGLAVALAAPPIRLDADTFLSVARAALLVRAPGSGPKLTGARWEAPALVATYDRPLLDGFGVEARVCGVPTTGELRARAGEVAFTVDPARCVSVDGATVIDAAIGEAPWAAPIAASDGALAIPAHARVVVP